MDEVSDRWNSDTREVVALLEPYLERRRYPAGRVLWVEGEKAGRMVLLDEGRVKIVRDQPDGRRVLLYLFGPGDLFGFLPFLDGGPYPATAIAVDDIRARVMSRRGLKEAVRENPDVALLLLRTLGRRLRDAFQRVGDFAQREAAARVAAGLAVLLPPGGSSGTLILEIPEHGYLFAEEVGVEPATFSRTLTRLVQDGVLHRLGPKRLQVLDPERLRRLASGEETYRLVCRGGGRPGGQR